MATVHPWNMRDGESSKAYQAFELYRDAGPDRSHERVASDCGKSVSLIRQWSAAHGWADRVRAFDEAAAVRASERALEDAATVRARQAKDAKEIQMRAMKKLSAADPDAMTVAEATRAWQVGAEAERKALGIAERTELTGANGGPVETRIVFGYDDGDSGDSDG